MRSPLPSPSSTGAENDLSVSSLARTARISMSNKEERFDNRSWFEAAIREAEGNPSHYLARPASHVLFLARNGGGDHTRDYGRCGTQDDEPGGPLCPPITSAYSVSCGPDRENQHRRTQHAPALLEAKSELGPIPGTYRVSYSIYLFYVGAGTGGRTPMGRSPADFESAASATSAIPARCGRSQWRDATFKGIFSLA
jgi:hypothetical protein